MLEALLNILLGGFLASVAWFVLSGILYLNPFIGRIYKRSEDSPALRKWPHLAPHFFLTYINQLYQSLIAAALFSFMKPVLPDEILFRGLLFGVVLLAVKTVPHITDSWLQTTYRTKLLVIELVNGMILGFAVSYVLAAVI
ncbi:MAG: hypothetical protein OEZ36_07425 [Spirochaetota bacterium]|nr:hypothetical protein [Spirochaetota bacterium]